MRKLKLFFACLLMAVLSIGQMWATDEVVYTLTPVAGSDNGYATNEDIDITDGETTITWNVTGNATLIPWRIGGKNLSGVNREVYSKDAMSAAITKVELTVGTASSVTVNSLKLIVASDKDFSDVIDEVTEDFTASSTITFEPTSPATKWATGAYYKFVFNVTIGSNNKFVQFTEAKFYAEAAAPAYTITAQSNDESKGTVSLTGSVITGSPKANCRYASPAYTVTSGNATVAQSGNAFTVTPSSDCTVRINFEAIPQYVVTWNINGNEDTKTNVYAGEKPEFPTTPAACDATSTTFIGWATAPWTGKLANLSGKTVYTSADAMPAVSAAVTYYAVFAKSSGSASNLFEWEGGSSADLTAEGNHVTAQGLGSDYAAGNSPYLVKLDGTGDYIIIDTEAAIGSVEIGVKMIGGANTSSITVQEADSKNAELFTDVETLSISGAQNDVVNLATTNAFASTSRAVKLLFTKGSNVGVGPITIAGAVSMSDYMTTCCTKRAITIASGIENGTVSADPTSACEGATVTLTFTPAGGYHLESWSVNGTAQDVAENTFTMPDEAVTVSATFVHDDCTNLLAPTLDGVTKTYNSATIAWNTVTDAVAYAVSVVKDGESEPVFSGNVNALSKELAGLEPETQYNYTIMAIGDGTVKCADGNGVLAGNFTTEPLPTAHLTLIDPDGTHESSGDYAILTPFNLPTTAASCAKTFMGWDSDDECATAPEYAAGAAFTFANTTGVTLYAVYADVTGGGTNTTNIAYSGSTTNMTGNNDAATFGLDADDWSVVGAKGNNANYPGLNTAGDIRLYYSAGGGNTLTITAPQTITSVGLTFTDATYNNAYVKVGSETVALSDGVYPINATSFEIGNANTSNVQVRISNIAVNFTTPGTPSNYSTTCAAAPEVIVDPEEINATAAAVAAGVITAAYDNVDEEKIAVAMYNDQACSEAFDGGWLTASINGDNNIAYSIAENTSYASDRKAYIKLTAPASSTGVAAATVVIPVTQAKKAAVFASLEDLVASDAPANSNVTVSFSNVVIKEIYMYNSNRRGLTFNIQKAGHDIKIYFNADVPAAWVAGGKVSGTLTNCPWKIYSEAWQLAPTSGWAWDNGDLTYTAPPAISSIEIRGTATAKTYIDGQAFNPAGLSVIAIYDNSDEEDVTAYATWTFDPAKLSEGDTEVEVTAEYNDKSDTKAVDGLTVNPIPNKTIGEFIAAGGTRCYLEGTVGTIDNSTYGNFWLTDASGEIYVYGCLTSAGESGKFNTLGVSAGDKIKVIAVEYVLYQKVGDPDKDEAKNVVFVSKKSPATMTFNPMALEFGDVETMAPATITLADASDIEYSIKDGSDDCVTIAGDQITAKSVAGTATIVATLAETDDYVGATAEFAVTVSAPITKYAITFDGNGADGGDAPAAIVAQAENAEVTLPANTWTKDGCKFDGWKVINNSTSAEVSVAGGKFSMPASAVTIQAQWAEIPSWAYVYDNNVVVAHTGSGTDDGTITISETEYKLVKAGAGSNTGTIKVTVPAGATDLHFHAFAWGGKTAKIQIAGVENASISEFDLAGEAGAAGSGNDFTLQGVPVDQYYHVSFDAVADETEIVFSKANGSADNRFFFYGVNQEGGDFGSYQRSTTCGNYGTICLPYAGTISGATLFEIADYENDMIYCDEITDGKMIAGRPYIFYATSGSLNVAYTANVAAAAGNHNGLYGFYDLTDDEAIQDLTEDAGNYILYQNAYWLVSGRAAYIANYRAYIKIGMINYTAPLPGRRRVAMAVNGKQTPTDIDAINASEKPMKLMIDGQMFILRGEKMYNANGQVVK